MTHVRLAILTLALLLPLTVAAGPALAASSQLEPSAPGLAPPAPPRPRAQPVKAAVPPAAHSPRLPHTGLPVGTELLLAGALGLLGAGLRARSRAAGLVHLEPVHPRGR